MTLEKRFNLRYILLWFVRTSGIDKPAARKKQLRCRIKNIRLKSDELLKLLLRPVPASIGPTAKNACV